MNHRGGRVIAPWVGLVATACGGAVPPLQHEPAPSAAPPAVPLPSATATTSASASPPPTPPPSPAVTLGPAPDTHPSSPDRPEFLAPISEQVVRLDRATRLVVRTRLVSPAPGARLLIALDQHPARVHLPGALPIAQLLPTQQPLAPGPHHLVALALSAAGEVGGGPTPVAALRFWVGDRPPDAGTDLSPRVFIGSPRGTINGPDAAVPLQLFPLGVLPSGAQVRVRLLDDRVAGPPLLDVALPLPADARVVARSVGGLPSGDFRVEAALSRADHTPLGDPVSELVTVNRDLKPPSR